ncbi:MULTISPECIES: hypothetical protein [unclassified Legionella]|uniref:hypothetical protein n=1 Tax=unclassified Legionella TaxID=2622702 RepID=UPI001E550255|nr:hypothetical protein [Legionella sp. 31fI33]MCC5016343.1 hypothetical protein [Legionella sp. 31fI33]
MTLRELEIDFIPKLIDALRKDIATAKHSGEVNFQVLDTAISLLGDIDKYTSLSLERLMVGIINFAVCLQTDKYANIYNPSIGEAVSNQYRSEIESWFNMYRMARKVAGSPLSATKASEIAIRTIEQASRSPLYLTPCLPHTLKVYFDYLQQLDSTFVPPVIPTGSTFAKWSKEEFIKMKVYTPSSLLNLSLFAAKKAVTTHALPIDHLPADLQEKLTALPADAGNEAVDDIDPFIPPPGSYCAII